ncbi:hypothetical protein [Corynebacterium aquilae]|uniref:hypothetical protein n=1 Tax=Corynebacterium aquilae TaxID=203263 RepID=UPI000952012B|nr:hypothetical protein [Corynebacterium aquilae]
MADAYIYSREWLLSTVPVEEILHGCPLITLTPDPAEASNYLITLDDGAIIDFSPTTADNDMPYHCLEADYASGADATKLRLLFDWLVAHTPFDWTLDIEGTYCAYRPTVLFAHPIDIHHQPQITYPTSLGAFGPVSKEQLTALTSAALNR